MMNDEETTSIGPYIFNEKYCIGQGSYGKVYRGKHNVDNEIVAIKEIDSNFVTEQEIQKQISILKQFQHPNIVKYKDTFENNGYFYIVTEFCNGGDLRNLMDDSDVQQESSSSNPQRVQQLLDMFFQVCEGFNYLKQFNIIHRDLKPSNILIHNGVYKIADFGVARAEKLHKSLIQNDLIGVPIYMSPQVLSKNFYTYKCDVWSLGVIFFQFFFEKLPWRASDTDRLFFQIMSHPTPYLEEKKQMPTMVKMILEHTLRYLQRERYSWSDLIALQKNRKKIFTDYTRTKSVHSQKKVPSYTDLSGSKINNTIPKNEAELVNHIICQSQSQAQELQKLVGKECFMAFLNTSRNYLIQGYHYRQCFIDCGFFFLKIAGEKLHVYMIDLEHLEDSRQLLILLELVHDLVTLPENYNQEKLKNDVSSSYRNDHIETYAASVISKINTYRFSEKRI